MNEIKLTVRPFEMDTLKEAAKKVQEEAGEAFAEYVILQEQQGRSTTRLADEISDVIQAACNLAVRYDINLQAAMERCERRNRERGRYGDADTNGIRESSVGDTANRRWMDSDSGGNDSPTCACDRSGVVDFDGNRNAHYETTKSPEEMSAAELIEALKVSYSASSTCVGTLGADWCEGFDYCNLCRKQVIDLLKAAHEREIEKVRVDTICAIARGEIAEMKQQISDLTHERDGLRRRLAELSDAGITELHRLLRETVGEAKNITDNARVYIDKQQGSKDEHCGSRGSIWRNHGGDCGAERVGEHHLPAEPPAQEMSEREAVIERLRELELTEKNIPLYKIVYAVLGHEPVTWWSKENLAELRDKLIELLSSPGWDYCKTCELTESEQRIARLEKSNDWLTSRCGQLEERVFELGKKVHRAAIIEKGLRNRGMRDMADEFADFHDVTEDAYAAFLALLKVDDGE